MKPLKDNSVKVCLLSTCIPDIRKSAKLFEGSKRFSLVLRTVALTWKGVRSIGGMVQNYLRRNVSQCHFVHHKSHWPEIEPGSTRRKASDKPSDSRHGQEARNASELYAESPLLPHSDH